MPPANLKTDFLEQVIEQLSILQAQYKLTDAAPLVRRPLSPLEELPPEIRTKILLEACDFEVAVKLESLWLALPHQQPSDHFTVFQTLHRSLFPASHHIIEIVDVKILLPHLLTLSRPTIAWISHFVKDKRNWGIPTFGTVPQAVSYHRLDIVRLLHIAGCTGFSDMMELASQLGHTDIVAFLHENRPEGCTVNAMNSAACNGHLSVIRYLHENRSEGCSAHAMDTAALNGHLNVVKYLHENRFEGCTSRAMDYAAQNGHFEIVRFLHERRREGCSSRALEYAAMNGHERVVRFLVERRKEGCVERAMEFAAKKGYTDIVRFLRETFERDERCGDRQIHWVEEGRLEMIVQVS